MGMAMSYTRVLGAIIDSSMKFRNSLAFEITLLVVVFVGGHFLWQRYHLWQ